MQINVKDDKTLCQSSLLVCPKTMSEKIRNLFVGKTEATVVITVLDILVYATAIIRPLGLPENITLD